MLERGAVGGGSHHLQMKKCNRFIEEEYVLLNEIQINNFEDQIEEISSKQETKFQVKLKRKHTRVRRHTHTHPKPILEKFCNFQEEGIL